MSTRNMDLNDLYLNFVLQWIDQAFDAILNQNYMIIISRDPSSAADSVTIFHTTNMSIQLALLYDQDYLNISVVARSCIGTSEPAEIHIRLIDNCTLILKDDVIIMNYNCLSSVTTTTTDEVMVTSGRFTTDSTLDMATQQHGSSMAIQVCPFYYYYFSPIQASLIPWSHR
jgi:hypothetical protein